MKTAEIISKEASPAGTRQVIIDRGKQTIDVACYARSSLAPGHFFQDPAMVTEKQTTTIVAADMRVTIDAYKHIIMERI